MGGDRRATDEVRLLVGPPSIVAAPRAPIRCPLCGRPGHSQSGGGSSTRSYPCGAGYSRQRGEQQWTRRGICRRARRKTRYGAVVAWLKRKSPLDAERLLARVGAPEDPVTAQGCFICLTHPHPPLQLISRCPHCGAPAQKLGQPGDFWGYAYECFQYWGSTTLCSQPRPATVRAVATRLFSSRRRGQ